MGADGWCWQSAGNALGEQMVRLLNIILHLGHRKEVFYCVCIKHKDFEGRAGWCILCLSFPAEVTY